MDNGQDLDLIIGAPSYGSERIEYTGQTYVFSNVSISNGKLIWTEQKSVKSAENANSYGSTLRLWNNQILTSGVHYSTDKLRQVGIIETLDGAKNYTGPDYPYSWTGQSLQPIDNNRLAVSSHLAKVGGVETEGFVTILDENLNEIERIFHPLLRSDQFGYDMTVIPLNFEGSARNCLVVGAPISTYGAHTNAGSVMIFDSDTYEYLGKLDSDRALGRFGRTLEHSHEKLFVGAPRYHNVIKLLCKLNVG